MYYNNKLQSINLVMDSNLQYISVVPNLWPAGQKWPARPQKVALDLLKNFKNICATVINRGSCGTVPEFVGFGHR